MLMIPPSQILPITQEVNLTIVQDLDIAIENAVCIYSSPKSYYFTENLFDEDDTIFGKKKKKKNRDNA